MFASELTAIDRVLAVDATMQFWDDRLRRQRQFRSMRGSTGPGERPRLMDYIPEYDPADRMRPRLTEGERGDFSSFLTRPTAELPESPAFLSRVGQCVDQILEGGWPESALQSQHGGIVLRQAAFEITLAAQVALREDDRVRERERKAARAAGEERRAAERVARKAWDAARQEEARLAREAREAAHLADLARIRALMEADALLRQERREKAEREAAAERLARQAAEAEWAARVARERELRLAREAEAKEVRDRAEALRYGSAAFRAYVMRFRKT